MILERNLGGADRLFRLVLAVLFFQLLLVLEGPARLLGLLGALPLAAVLLGWSPLYACLGISTWDEPPTTRDELLSPRPDLRRTR